MASENQPCQTVQVRDQATGVEAFIDTGYYEYFSISVRNCVIG